MYTCVVLCSPHDPGARPETRRCVPLLLETPPVNVELVIRRLDALAEPIDVDSVFRSKLLSDILDEPGVYAVVIQFPPQVGNTEITAKLGVVGATMGTLGLGSGMHAAHEGFACFYRVPGTER